jgi:hypothetical protein
VIIMIIENIKLRIKHQQSFDKENISEKFKPINYLFDEVTIRSLSCVLKNEEKGYRVTVNRQFVDFELKRFDDRDIVVKVLNTLELSGASEDVKITLIPSFGNFIKNFNNLFKDMPDDVNSEFIGFRYTVNDVNYYISMVMNFENKLACRIGINLKETDLGIIRELLEEQSLIVEDRIIPLVNHFIEGVI